MMRLVLLLAFALVGPLSAQAQSPFVIESEFGDESSWVPGYLQKVHRELARMMNQAKVAPPSGIRVELKRNSKFKGVGGHATPTSLGFTSDQWPKDRYRVWILTHELANLFAAHYAGCGGFPSDWWANGRSPFPVYVAALVTRKLGETETAQWLRTLDRDRPDQRFIWALHSAFGFKLFAKFFLALREDAIDLNRIGAPWPAPDEKRAAWTLAYLSHCAGKNLAPLAGQHDIGKEPSDWSARHPELPFRPYLVTEAEIEELLAIRRLLFSSSAKDLGREALRHYFRSGLTWRNQSGFDKGQSPIKFSITSAFGKESGWTEPFLNAAAKSMLAMYEDPGLQLPTSVPVHLRANRELQGIGGGATAASIDMLSNQWPKEQWRQWIMATELSKLFAHHTGGKLPEDWFGTGGKPFHAYVACLTLQRIGLLEVAQWVRAMHKSKKGHEVFWQLHDRFGFSLFARMHALARLDQIDFSALPHDSKRGTSVRALYIMAYLSLAADENLADELARNGIGSAEASEPDANARVASIMNKRGELFGSSKGAPRERNEFRSGRF